MKLSHDPKTLFALLRHLDEVPTRTVVGSVSNPEDAEFPSDVRSEIQLRIRDLSDSTTAREARRILALTGTEEDPIPAFVFSVAVIEMGWCRPPQHSVRPHVLVAKELGVNMYRLEGWRNAHDLPRGDHADRFRRSLRICIGSPDCPAYDDSSADD